MAIQHWIKVYILTVAVAATLVASLTVWLWPPSVNPSELWMPPVFILLLVVAGRFPFKVSPQGDATVITRYIQIWCMSRG